MKKSLALGMIGVLMIASLTACGKQVKEEVHDITKVENITKENKHSINKNKDTEEETNETEIKEQAPDTETETQENLDDSTNFEKSVSLTDAIYKSNGTNTMFSPTSLNMALGLLAEGADKDTESAKALASYLGEGFADKSKDYINNKVQYFNKDENINGYNTVFEIANSIWVNDGLTISEEYKTKTQDIYGAEVDSIDINKPEESANKINKWCSDKTHELIQHVITPESINMSVSAILVNSVYLESPWEEEWYTLEDGNEDFENIDGSTSSVATIHKTGDAYYENDKATAFGVPYRNGMEFIGILPKELGEFTLSDLDIKNLIDEQESGNIQVDISMPELNFDTTAELTDLLAGTELEVIFKKSNDFIHMNDELQPAEVSSIIQKTKIELDRYGTKAAAVTAITMDNCMIAMDEVIRKEVHLDRPFAFMIYDRINDEVIFIGKVVNLD